MAIFHLSVKCFSRSKGHSVVAAAAYRSGEHLLDDRTGEICDYTRRGGVAYSSVMLPPGAPAWGRNELWNQAESAEKRKNSTVGREAVIAIPAELPRQSQIDLAERFAGYLVERYQVAVDIGIHQPHKGNDERNVHAHLLMSTRVLGPDGFGQKTRVLDAAATGSLEIIAWREAWATMANAALAEHGIEARIDHRSNAERGIDDVPTIKEGRTAGARDRREHNVEVRAFNDDMRQALTERAQAVVAEKIAEATAIAQRARAVVEARQVLAALPATRSKILVERDGFHADRQQVKARLSKAQPRRDVVDAQGQVDGLHEQAVLAATVVKTLKNRLEHELGWWRVLAKRETRQRLATAEPTAAATEQAWRETRAIARAPVQEELTKEDDLLRIAIKQREDQLARLNQIEADASKVLDSHPSLPGQENEPSQPSTPRLGGPGMGH